MNTSLLSKRLLAWLKASRIMSQIYIALPLLFGCFLAGKNTGQFLTYMNLSLVLLFGLFMQLFIVFSNDVADFETDKLNQTPTLFSGGSRVLVEKLLTSLELKVGSWLALFMALSCAIWLSVATGNFMIALLAFAGATLMWAYSYAPFKLSYRGGGEFLQMVGVGVVLPLLGYLSQGANLGNFPGLVFTFLLPIHLSCALATTLPDEPSDRISCKRTFSVIWGQEAVAILIVLLNWVGMWWLLLDVLSWNLYEVSYLLALPVICNFLVLLFRKSSPGSIQKVIQVSSAIGCTLSQLIIAIISLGRHF